MAAFIVGHFGEVGFHSGGRKVVRKYVCQMVTKGFPPSVVVLRDHEQAPGVVVYVIGCVHGSDSSRRDVELTFEEISGLNQRVASVVMELCQPRLNWIRRKGGQPRKLVWPWQRWSMALEQQRGMVGPAVVSALISVLQDFVQALAMGRGEQGVEFREGVHQAKKYGARLVPGDQSQDATIRHLYEAFNVVSNIQRLPDDVERFLRNLKWPRERVSFVRVLLRRSSLLDLFRVMASGFLLSALTVPLALALDSINRIPTFSVTSSDPRVASFVPPGVMDSLQLVIVGFTFSWMLRFLNALIYERDELLFHSIVREVSFETFSCHRSEQECAIVAICGLNHVNGIARLWESQWKLLHILNEKVLEDKGGTDDA
uniref:Uncharacterized protein n=1 Tax=Compsopogon caeruleus TaxID=31354 RepID=A0A7S1XH51_9RHOD